MIPPSILSALTEIVSFIMKIYGMIKEQCKTC
jgi:hypothetical protein